MAAKAGVKAGDALFFSADDQRRPAAKLAGAARMRLGRELGLIKNGRVQILLDRRLPDV